MRGRLGGPPVDPDYWHALINEKAAGDFLGLTDRAVQKMRRTMARGNLSGPAMGVKITLVVSDESVAV